MLPDYLDGLKAPVPDEINAVDLPVTGELPAELNGRYFRNGPNPRPGEDRGHWFTGDGMLHGIRLRDGRAQWYRNRWISTAKFHGAPFVSDTGLDLTAVPANTSVIRHAGRMLALVETGLPYEITPGLETVGPYDFQGCLTTAMTAHPKRHPRTGELHFFGYGFVPPYLTYHRANAAGELVESRTVDVPGPTMVHDFAITENHVVWLDLPVVFDLELLGRGMPYRWDESYGARIGVMDRAGQTNWHEIDPCYVFHVGNACERDGAIELDAVRYSGDRFASMWPSTSGSGSLHRWIMTGTGVKEERLDDRSVEFPTINESLVGAASRFRYTVTDTAVVKYDMSTGSSHAEDLGRTPGEAVFVARGIVEDDGWLLSVVSDPEGSDLLVLDAADLQFVASVRLPRRVPTGFHGAWFPDLTPEED
ncbi:MAG TPA: carotenoid oxygenase family protein [Nonomuraea sp.]|nr:carotenoid oxygenase family protein [Nonomuraea sp.]